ncbi:DUF4376 domain-containing protein [Azospirillum sp. ST 5-10]|uniref:DUF4376 domain-containing protein n=1 Tax=unclassified Azospirillum TaxID=2630922 RepID=UPI003F4A4DC3
MTGSLRGIIVSNAYSHRGAIPTSLPFAIRLSDGRLRTDPSTFTEDELTDAGYVLAPAQPAYDPATQHAPVWTGAGWQVVDKTPAELAAELAAAKEARCVELETLRRQKEEASYLTWDRSDGETYLIYTDPGSQAKLDAEWAAAAAGLRQPPVEPWKCVDAGAGKRAYLSLTDAEVMDIAQRARSDVIAPLFRREAELCAAIDAATTVQAVAAVAIETGWPT